MFYTHTIRYGKYRMATPTNIIQYAEDESHISWNTRYFHELKSTVGYGAGVETTKPLLHIARQPKHDIKMKTYYLQATGFNFGQLPNVISGIVVKIKIDRGGRITDETVQLCVNNALIGENRAVLSLEQKMLYGGEMDTWSIEGLNSSMLQDPSFGLTLRYKSHPAWPHKTSPTLHTVEIEIH